MRSTTLIALLPLLAATNTFAHPHHPPSQSQSSSHSHDDESITIRETIRDILAHHSRSERTTRKSLNFGPVHSHARFITPSPSESSVVQLGFQGQGQGDWTIKDVARGVVRGIQGLEEAVEGEDYYIRKDVSNPKPPRASIVWDAWWLIWVLTKMYLWVLIGIV